MSARWFDVVDVVTRDTAALLEGNDDAILASGEDDRVYVLERRDGGDDDE